MALVKSTGTGVMSGKLGGMVFQRNGRVRTGFMPSNPRTTAQDIVRAAFTTAAADYAVIPAATLDAWDAYAVASPRVNRVGGSYTLTGKQQFISLNAPRLLADLAVIQAPPTLGQINFITVPGQIDLVLAATTQLLYVSGVSLAAGVTMAAYIGQPRSPLSRRGSRKLAFAGVLTGNVVPVITGSFTLPTGNAVVDNVYDVELVTYSSDTFSVTRQTFTVKAT